MTEATVNNEVIDQPKDDINEKLMQHEVTLTYKVGELNNLLLALGDLPFVKVQNIVSGIHTKVQPQITKFLEENSNIAKNEDTSDTASVH
jgi:hypothetical protein